MTIGRYIKMKMSERGINQIDLAEMAGFKNQSNISMLLRDNSNMRLNSLFSLLDALNCELVIRDKATQRSDTIEQNIN